MAVELNEKIHSGHLQYKFKCLNCGLHFIVYSEYHDWKEKAGKFCPECGKNDKTMLLTTEKSSKFIFELVSG